MSELLPIFDDEPQEKKPEPEKISESQRAALRTAFARLGISGARNQFETVWEMTGQRITSVLQLEARNAQLLIHKLGEKTAQGTRSSTGNAWTDREEDTWIDKL